MNTELLQLGMERHKARDYANSIKLFTQAVGETPNDLMSFNVYLLIGEAKYKIGDYAGSVEAYNKGLNFYQANVSLFNQHHSQIVEATKVVLEQAYRIRGNGKKEIRDFQGAIQDYSKAIELNNQLSDAIYSRGVIYLETGNFIAAKADFTKIIALNPNDAPAYKNLGNAKFQLGDYNGAIDDYTKAINLSIGMEHRGEVYNNRGLSKASLGRYQEAIKDFDEAIAINPGDSVALDNRQILLSQLNRR